MYQPIHFREERLDVLHGLIRDHPLGMLVTKEAGGLVANPVPFMVNPAGAAYGTLQAHVARANRVWLDFDRDVEALVIFQGPRAYISPSFYPSKKEHGRVVPTWNYAVVQCHGPLVVRDDPAWVRAQIEALTLSREKDRATPWAVNDAPDDFVAAQVRQIVGIEIPIGRIEGKWKMSQNRSAGDRQGVAEGLRDDGAQDHAAVANSIETAKSD